MNPSVYSRPNKPKAMTVTRRQARDFALSAGELPEVTAVGRETECHVTPPAIAARMAGYLEWGDGVALDPQGGTGNLVHALLDAGYPKDRLISVERHYTLYQILAARCAGVTVERACFLEWAGQVRGKLPIDAIITNPPFRQVRAHMKAALSLIENGGQLVGLVPVTYEHPDAETLETLDRETFPTAAVASKIISIRL